MPPKVFTNCKDRCSDQMFEELSKHFDRVLSDVQHGEAPPEVKASECVLVSSLRMLEDCYSKPVVELIGQLRCGVISSIIDLFTAPEGVLDTVAFMAWEDANNRVGALLMPMAWDKLILRDRIYHFCAVVAATSMAVDYMHQKPQTSWQDRADAYEAEVLNLVLMHQKMMNKEVQLHPHLAYVHSKYPNGLKGVELYPFAFNPLSASPPQKKKTDVVM